MPYSEKLFACAGCGKAVFACKSENAEVRCLECSIERSTENMHQMRYRYGAFYSKWAAGMRRAADEAIARAAVNEITERRK